MRFIPHTAADIAQMLAALDVERLDDLVAHVPAALRAQAAIRLDRGLGEREVSAAMRALAQRNAPATELISFLGGGCYRHYIPAAVRAITARAEFATSYTPYQPEASQGTTQAIFEFQTLITQLTGLEVANASMYDGASAAAEAVLMARRILPKRHRVVVSRALWPDYRATIATYLSAQQDLEIVELPLDLATGSTSCEALGKLADQHLLCAVVGYPNAFGVIESLGHMTQVAHEAGALLIAVTAEPLAFGLLKSPGELGADIAVGEGQSFGIAPQFGGPGVGFMAARMAHVRSMPGRLVGETRDRQGRRAFCLTLAAREQHIRRERATSNICTNHSLNALAATVYLALMGRSGLRRMAARNVDLAHQAAAKLAAVGISPRFSGAFFNEFVARVPDPHRALERAIARGVLAGLTLERDYPELADGLLIAVTEVNEPQSLDLLAEALRA